MTMSDEVITTVRLPKAIHEALKEAAASDERTVAAALRIAIKRYIENPKGVSANPVKEVAKPKPDDGLTPQQRTAKTKAEQKKEREREAHQQKLASRPERTADGYEIFRGELSSWTPSNPGEGYEAVPDQLNGETIWVRMPIEDYEATKTVTETRYKADLPEGLEDVDDADD